MNEWIEKYKSELKKYWLIPVMIFAGILLMMRPSADQNQKVDYNAEQQDYIRRMEAQIQEMLLGIEGAGECKVSVSLASGGRKEYVREAGSVLVITDKNGNETPVLAREGLPEIAGITIASAGAGSVSIRNRIIEAVSTLTDVGTNKICVVMVS
ncbi:MAG: hypothetical protein IJN80_00725 [Clostridia bacterium]|nr:hypothetical protein [Clostridia bacterium]